MAIELKYDSEESIPEGFADLYSESNGEWRLSGVVGLKTPDDIARLTTSLTKERDAHKATKAKYQGFNGLDADEVVAKLDRIAELEQASGGALDESKLGELVETRIGSRIKPVERKLNDALTQIAERDALIEGFQKKERKLTIDQAVRKAARAANVVETAVDDALLLGSVTFEISETGDVINSDGMTPDVWFTQIKSTRPHWFHGTSGAGARGGSGSNGFNSNPFAAETWNMTEQGRILRSDPNRANMLAKAAGTTVGGGKPAAKK